MLLTSVVCVVLMTARLDGFLHAFSSNVHYCFLTSWNDVCNISSVCVTARLVNFVKLKFVMIFQPQLHAKKLFHRC